MISPKPLRHKESQPIVTADRQDRISFHLTETVVFLYHEETVLVTESSST